MRGRPPKPTKILEDKGSFDHDPQRRAKRKNEPKPNGPIGAPPAYFDAIHKAVWKEIVAESAKGVLAKSDRKHLELTVRLTCKMRLAPGRLTKPFRFFAKALVEMGMPEKDVATMIDAFKCALGCSSQELSLLSTCLTRLGMTPADRVRVHGDDDEEEVDPFAALGEAFATIPVSKRVQ